MLPPEFGISDVDLRAVPEPVRFAFLKMMEWAEKTADRPKQRIPFNTAFARLLVMSGRGWGKTALGINWIMRHLCFPAIGQPTAVGIVCPTRRDAQRLLERPDGLLNLLPPPPYTRHDKSELKGELWNGSTYEIFSSERPTTLRGPNLSHVLWDEAATARYIEVWPNIQACLRLGKNPQLLVTTTPKRNEITQKLREKIAPEFRIHGETAENKRGLSAQMIKDFYEDLANTPLGRQEIYGEYIDEVPGAMFNNQNISDNRITQEEADNIQHLSFVVGVDPQGFHRRRHLRADIDDTAGLGLKKSETGIVVVSRAIKKDKTHFYVHEDLSGSYPPDEWARLVCETAERYGASIAVENNFGGDMVANTLWRFNDSKTPINERTAQDSKMVRAQPIAIDYAKGRVHHIEYLPHLEEEMTSFTDESRESPNRLDALVWAIRELQDDTPFIIMP